MALRRNDIESELSYAYLHAVSARAAFACEQRSRHADNDGIDATIHVAEKLDNASQFTKFDINVQLKATSRELPQKDGRLSYELTIDHYNKLRDPTCMPQLILVLLVLPGNEDEWLHHTEKQLVARRCAYWVSLRNAPFSSNQSTKTVHIPVANMLSPGGLRELATRVSRCEVIDYVA